MNRIKQLREENNITQIQLAKKLNKTQQTISLYENGTNEPDLDGYIILSKLFNCSIEYVAGKSDIRNSDEQQYYFAYHKEMDGLTPDEIVDALKFYKEMKNKINKKEQ
nr:MAG TPA: Helix-turn-helix XRE-family like protein [Caudoviricetes sp.]